MADDIREPSSAERAEMEYYMSLDVDALLVTIGRTSVGAGGFQFSPDTAHKEGERWFEWKKAAFRRLICDQWGYAKRRSHTRLQDRVTLALAIADLICTEVGGPPVFSVAALLVKIGLDDLCGCK
jgi:hypothetical protein